jgi:hypothetical protein
VADEIITPYPLQWPQGMPRTQPMRRVRTPFKTGYHRAVENVVKSLQGFQRDSGLKIEHPVLSSNVDLMGRLFDGDPGAAAWFKMDGQWVAFGVDRFPDAASNVQAIHHIIEARRVELRYGGLSIVRQTFKAFLSLPAPAGSHWSEVLGVSRSATRDQIEAAHRDLAKKHHPDAGGSDDMMAKINQAKSTALTERA